MSKTPKQLATEVLAHHLGVPQRGAPQLTEAQQTIADFIAGRSRPEPGTPDAELEAALRSSAEQHDRGGVIARTPSDELREVITDVLRGMHARGELE